MRIRSVSEAFFERANKRAERHAEFEARKSDHFSSIRGVGAILTLSLLTLSMASFGGQTKHDLNTLKKDVENYLSTTYTAEDAVKLEISLGNLDPRLALPACDQPLSMKLNDATLDGGSVTVQTRCEGVRAWSIHVPAQVAIFRSLVVASRDLARGDRVRPGDLATEVVNTSQLRQGFLRDAKYIVGQELQRPLQKGEPFRSAILDSPMVIKRGDSVSIEADAGTITVRSTGTAMANGRVGEQIRVKNTQSDRILSAEVVSEGKVRTAI